MWPSLGPECRAAPRRLSLGGVISSESVPSAWYHFGIWSESTRMPCRSAPLLSQHRGAAAPCPLFKVKKILPHFQKCVIRLRVVILPTISIRPTSKISYVVCVVSYRVSAWIGTIWLDWKPCRSYFAHPTKPPTNQPKPKTPNPQNPLTFKYIAAHDGTLEFFWLITILTPTCANKFRLHQTKNIQYGNDIFWPKYEFRGDQIMLVCIGDFWWIDWKPYYFLFQFRQTPCIIVRCGVTTYTRLINCRNILWCGVTTYTSLINCQNIF